MVKLPIGFHRFHKRSFFNYQLNRWYSLGYTQKAEIEQVAKRINNTEDYRREFWHLAEQAHAEGRLKNAAFYFRAAEFFVPPDHPEKQKHYERFIQEFYQAFEEEKIVRHQVPFRDGYLRAMQLSPQDNSREEYILLFGGFDSFIEEFFCIWKFFADQGFEVIAFEGPGQGGTLRKGNLTFDHDWEKPTSAILDYFKIEKATLIGVSMGGYWCLRAAAFEQRIEKVIAFAVVYDWMAQTNALVRWLVSRLVQWNRFMNWSLRLRMRFIPILKHTIHQILYFTRETEPLQAVHWLLGMNKKHICSEQVNQDVLLLGGQNDKFQPPILLHKQKQALINARSVEYRIFTKAEHADNHCQMGNLQLALDTMIQWIDKINRSSEFSSS